MLSERQPTLPTTSRVCAIPDQVHFFFFFALAWPSTRRRCGSRCRNPQEIWVHSLSPLAASTDRAEDKEGVGRPPSRTSGRDGQLYPPAANDDDGSDNFFLLTAIRHEDATTRSQSPSSSVFPPPFPAAADGRD